jgi:hypothetical protein
MQNYHEAAEQLPELRIGQSGRKFRLTGNRLERSGEERPVGTRAAQKDRRDRKFIAKATAMSPNTPKPRIG